MSKPQTQSAEMTELSRVLVEAEMKAKIAEAGARAQKAHADAQEALLRFYQARKATQEFA